MMNEINPLPHVKAGKLILLNINAPKRSTEFPDAPTLTELGYPYVIDSPFGIGGPKGMDPKVVAKLHDAFKKALEEPSVLAVLERYDMIPNYKNTADYRTAVTEQIALEKQLLERIGLSKKD